jgi:hypothetical protein
MREIRSYGSVRGASGNRCPYRDVRRLETGMELRMKESYRKGVANHPDPESCVACREAAIEA